ncbi:unnamed protein product, partial [Discosporangium mesarthrocarpum]
GQGVGDKEYEVNGRQVCTTGGGTDGGFISGRGGSFAGGDDDDEGNTEEGIGDHHALAASLGCSHRSGPPCPEGHEEEEEELLGKDPEPSLDQPPRARDSLPSPTAMPLRETLRLWAHSNSFRGRDRDRDTARGRFSVGRGG